MYRGVEMTGDYMKAVRLPTQHKSKRHKCSQCQRKDAEQYRISEKETRWLCVVCKNKFNAQFNEEKYANFIDAGRLYRSMKNG